MGRALVDDVNQEIITAGAAAPQSDPVGATAEVRASAEIAASIAQQVTYATHQNEVPVIADLRLANRGEEDLEDLVLTLLVDPPLIAEKRWRIDRLPAGGELRLRDRKVSLSGAILSRPTDKRRAELFLRLTRGDELLAEEQREIGGLAQHAWGGVRPMPALLAAPVIANDPADSRLLQKGQAIRRRCG